MQTYTDLFWGPVWSLCFLTKDRITIFLKVKKTYSDFFLKHGLVIIIQITAKYNKINFIQLNEKACSTPQHND